MANTFPPSAGAGYSGYAFSNDVEMQAGAPQPQHLHHLHHGGGAAPSQAAYQGYPTVSYADGGLISPRPPNPTIVTSGPGVAYPSYAHYDIPDRSPDSSPNASIARDGGGSSSGVPAKKGKWYGSGNLKQAMNSEDEYPPGWSKDDQEAEREFLQKGLFNWRDFYNWRFWIRVEWWYYYVALIVITVLVVLTVVFHDQIVHALEPAARWMQNLTAGWVIPIAVLFIISFPPLFGHEIVAIICGLVWGLWVGFGIVAAGTFLGEVGNFYAFKYCCRSRAEKYEKKNMTYACLSYVMRHGSIWIIIAARLSAIPGHFTTAVFATCGMNIWVFMIAAVLTLPKQLITVYLGVLFGMQKGGEGKSTKDRIISYSVLAVGVIITVASAWWIYHQMHKVRVIVWRRQRMEAASRGVSLSTLSYGDGGMVLPPHRRGSEVAGDIDSARPILHRQLSDNSNGGGTPHHEPIRSSYHTPFDISYKKAGDMSVYHLPTTDADAVTASGRELQRAETDLTDKLHQYQERSSRPSSPTKAARNAPHFPAALQTGDTGAQLQRDPTLYNRPAPQAIPSAFPDANPYAVQQPSNPYGGGYEQHMGPGGNPYVPGGGYR